MPRDEFCGERTRLLRWRWGDVGGGGGDGSAVEGGGGGGGRDDTAGGGGGAYAGSGAGTAAEVVIAWAGGTVRSGSS